MNSVDSMDEPLKYIGYSMSKKRWIIIQKKQKRDDTYEFLNAGATAFTYVNKANNKLVKIIHGPRYIPEDNYAGFIKECEKEIEYQHRAADNGLGPRIYIGQYGFVPKEHSFYSKDESPYFYIIMEYLSEKNGWKHIFIGDKPDSVFCNYIQELVSKTGLINVTDPQAHFYYNDKKDKLYMIDYGNFKECGKHSVSECIELMSSALGIKCVSKQTKSAKSTKSTKSTKSGGYTKQLQKRKKTYTQRRHKKKRKNT